MAWSMPKRSGLATRVAAIARASLPARGGSLGLLPGSPARPDRFARVAAFSGALIHTVRDGRAEEDVS